MNFFRNLCLDTTLLKVIPHLQGAIELCEIDEIGNWHFRESAFSLQAEVSATVCLFGGDLLHMPFLNDGRD